MNERMIELIVRAALYRGVELGENPQAGEGDYEGAVADIKAKAVRYMEADQELRDTMKRLESEVVR